MYGRVLDVVCRLSFQHCPSELFCLRWFPGFHSGLAQADLAGGTMSVMFPYAAIFFVLSAVCMLFIHAEDKPVISSDQTLSANGPAV
jgi:hypothetical protein